MTLKSTYEWWGKKIDILGKFLERFKYTLTIIGLISTSLHTCTIKKIINQGTEIEHKNNTIKLKTDSITTAKIVCSKSIDENPDTAVKYKRIAKLFYVKPIVIKNDSLNLKKPNYEKISK